MTKTGEAKIIEALAVAYNTEIKGYGFYRAAADMVEDEHGKNVFLHLAREELDHIRAIKAISDSLREGRGWLRFTDALKKAPPEIKEGAPIFQEKNELVERLSTNQTDQNAIQIAMENEEAAIEYYGRLLREAGDPVEKTVFTELVEMEKNHLKLLRWESEALNRTGFWCDMMEYSVEKEV